VNASRALFRAGVNLWALPGRLSWEEAMAAAAQAGFEGVEPNLDKEGWVTAAASAAELGERARAAHDAGVEITSLATGLLWENALTGETEEERRAACDTVKSMLRVASGLGADTVLVVPGAVDVFFMPKKPRVRYDLAMERLVGCLETLVPEAEREGVTIALETVWNRFLLSPLELRDLIDGFASERLGVYLDVGNLQATAYPEDWIDILGARIARVHVKGYRRSGGLGTADGFCSLLDGEIDWPVVTAALARAGYAGWLTAEMFKPSKAPSSLFLEETARQLRWICDTGKES
jgi:L-ribulose-5-phosphate 3-epimerase